MSKENSSEKENLIKAYNLIVANNFQELNNLFNNNQDLSKNINSPIRGGTLLHAACAHSNNKIINFLISNKADIEAKNNIGERPIHIAAIYHNLAAMSILKKNDADINAGIEKFMEESALHLAARDDRAEGIEALIVKSGASQYTISTNHMLPIDLAVRFKSYNAIRTLVNYCAIPSIFNDAQSYVKENLDFQASNELTFSHQKLSEDYLFTIDKVCKKLNNSVPEKINDRKNDPDKYDQFLVQVEYFYNKFLINKDNILRNKKESQEKIDFGDAMINFKQILNFCNADLVKAKRNPKIITDWKEMLRSQFKDDAERMVKALEGNVNVKSNDIDAKNQSIKNENLVSIYQKFMPSSNNNSSGSNQIENDSKQIVSNILNNIISNIMNNNTQVNQSQSFVARIESENRRYSYSNSDSFSVRDMLDSRNSSGIGGDSSPDCL